MVIQEVEPSREDDGIKFTDSVSWVPDARLRQPQPQMHGTRIPEFDPSTTEQRPMRGTPGLTPTTVSSPDITEEMVPTIEILPARHTIHTPTGSGIQHSNDPTRNIQQQSQRQGTTGFMTTPHTAQQQQDNTMRRQTSNSSQ